MAAAAAGAGLVLHAVWWSVLKPTMVVDPVSGQPGYQPVYVSESQAEAAGYALNIPGAAIVMHVVAHVNPAASALLRPPPRPG